MLMRQNLDNNAEGWATYIKIALDTFSNADKASHTSSLDKTREVSKDTFSGRGGRANDIANSVHLLHSKEYAESSPRV